MKITNVKNIISGTALGLAILAGGTLAHAQETQTQPQTDQKTEKRWKHGRGDGFGRGGRHGGKEMRLFGQLNLTDAQKEQLKQIAERYRESNKTLHEQLRASRQSTDAAQREQLFAQFKESHQRMQAEMLNVLTAEQRTQLDQLKEQRRQMREQRRQQFELRRKQREAQQTPTIN